MSSTVKTVITYMGGHQITYHLEPHVVAAIFRSIEQWKPLIVQLSDSALIINCRRILEVKIDKPTQT